MQNRKTSKMVPQTSHSTHNSNISSFTNEELERALPRLSFFDCHAKASRINKKNVEPSRRYDCKSDRSDITIKNFDEPHLERNSSYDMINVDNKSYVLDSCKTSYQNENSIKIKSISNYFEADSVSNIPTYSYSQANNIKTFQNADKFETKNSTASLENESFYMKELSDSTESFEVNNFVLKDEKGETIKVMEKNKSQSEGFQYLMEYLLYVKNTSDNNDKEIDSSFLQKKSSDPKYLVDSLKKSASIFAPQHRVHSKMNNNNLFTAAQQLHSRLIVSTSRSTNLDPSSCEKSCSELDERRNRLDQWIEKVSTSEFMNTRDEVLSILEDSSCKPWSGFRNCRYLRLPPSQLINYTSLQN